MPFDKDIIDTAVLYMAEELKTSDDAAIKDLTLYMEEAGGSLESFYESDCYKGYDECQNALTTAIIHAGCQKNLYSTNTIEILQDKKRTDRSFKEKLLNVVSQFSPMTMTQ